MTNTNAIDIEIDENEDMHIDIEFVRLDIWVNWHGPLKIIKIGLKNLT